MAARKVSPNQSATQTVVAPRTLEVLATPVSVGTSPLGLLGTMPSESRSQSRVRPASKKNSVQARAARNE
jgi:hypothetical protein